LDLSLGTANKKKFINHNQLDAKGRKARKEEVENEDEEDQVDEENQNTPFSAHMAKNRRERLTEYYSLEPRALPSKEVKPLKNSKLDRFANTIEINLDLASNTQIKAIEAIEQGHKNIGFWHLQNASDFIRNDHAIANLKRIKIRDPSSTNAVRNYIDRAELISPQMKQIIEQQKKLMPKNYQNFYYRRIHIVMRFVFSGRGRGY
jgi:hypothetical protein